MIFIGFISVPLLIAIVGYLVSKEISVKEMAVIVGVLAVVSGISVAVCYYGNTSDTEVWNGVVRSKNSEHVSCSHSYKCNCHTTCTGSGKDQRCSESCSTCYDHPYDVDWNVFTSNGETIKIDRIDRQGVDQPPRWTAVRIGEPTTLPHRFTNYIKGSPGTLFRNSGQADKFKGQLPKYPEVYDYFRMDRLIADPGTVSGQASWNASLSEINGRLGSAKQVNAIVIVTRQPREFFYALEESWIGGKKNDAILVIGVDSDSKPVWTEVMAWVKDEGFKVKLKEDALNLPKVEREATLAVFEKNIAASYQRKPMHDFEYLKASIVPSTLQWVLVLLISSLISFGLVWYFHNNDPFEDIRRVRRENSLRYGGYNRYGSSYSPNRRW